MSQTQQQSQPQAVPETKTNKLLLENNQRAYELLLRIQSQCEANKVYTVTSKKESA